MREMEGENRDFKYVLQDVSRIYIGARYTYGEMMDTEDIPFKFRAILSHYMLKEVEADTTLENHIFFIKKDQLSYLAYGQLKAKFRLNMPVDIKNGVWRYKSDYYGIDAIVESEELHARMDEIIVEEMMISKMSMAMMSL